VLLIFSDRSLEGQSRASLGSFLRCFFFLSNLGFKVFVFCFSLSRGVIRGQSPTEEDAFSPSVIFVPYYVFPAFLYFRGL